MARLMTIWQATASWRAVLRRPEIMAFLPAVTLAAFWLGGEEMLVLTALATPLLFALAGAFRFTADPVTPVMGLSTATALTRIVADQIAAAAAAHESTGVLIVQIDDVAELYTRHGPAAMAEIHDRVADRLISALRREDRVARMGDGRFAIALEPVPRLDIEAMVQIAARLQASVMPPLSLDATRIYITASVGFCAGARAPGTTAEALIDAASDAATDAVRQGPAAIRAWTPDVTGRSNARGALRDMLEAAFLDGQFVPWFQPQVSTETGALTGFEALARWQHPERGIVPPAEFLAAVTESGMGPRLADVMLVGALSALRDWDRAGLHVPRVAINLSDSELRDPKLVDRIRWELDRFDLRPERLACEVLETVIAQTDDDVIVRNLAALAGLGCLIELDDFGTGHAAIGNVRRFSVSRIKIDRSFVARVGQDREQQRCVTAILAMAEHLGLDTLAEGDETAEDHTMLAQLGCRHVQGFSIARAMPLAETMAWLPDWRARMRPAPRIASRQH